MNQEKTILIISVAYGVTLIAFGFLVRYYRNKIQKEFEFGNRMFNKYYDISFRNGTVEKHNSKYSKICRRLYDQLHNEKLEHQAFIELFKLRGNKIKELELKLAELEKSKLKEKRGKR